MSEEERKAVLDKELITLNMDEMCEYLHCGKPKLVQVIAQDKEFPVFKIGKENRVYLPALQEYLSKRHILR